MIIEYHSEPISSTNTCSTVPTPLLTCVQLYQLLYQHVLNCTKVHVYSCKMLVCSGRDLIAAVHAAVMCVHAHVYIPPSDRYRPTLALQPKTTWMRDLISYDVTQCTCMSPIHEQYMIK